MNLGIIIIGSLFWSDHRNRNNPDNIRKKWRLNHLDTNNAIKVYLPIRYGRRSKDNIFTMVFSTSLEKSKNNGIGFVIPVKSNPIKNFEDLLNEALQLAKAEGIGSEQNPKLFASWGASIGVLAKNGKNEFQNKWIERFRHDGGGKDSIDYRVNRERRSIDENGNLQIMWPQVVDYRDKKKLEEIDVIIGASTKPKYSLIDGKEIFKYPTINELKETIMQDTLRNYFLNNLNNGIMTYQDFRLLKKMQQLKN
ncbi:MAG: hypothetical protein AAF502_17930 [Bacteroidota bacterium]